MSDLRNYVSSQRQTVVEDNYRKNHEEMTMERVLSLRKKWLPCRKGLYSIKNVIDMLDHLVDDSDPDVDIQNNVHDFQTAERARKAFPGEKYDWLHLVGLIHDLGKVMSLWGEPQHLVVGDTYVVGCKHPSEIVFHEYFSTNPDTDNPAYNTSEGMYEKGCGMSNVLCSWSHDEYMYWVLKEAGCTLPPWGLNIIRFHSCYAWHSRDAYKNLTNEFDRDVTLPWLKTFNKFDLYSKTDPIPDCEKLWNEYYSGLCDKFNIGGLLMW